LLWERLRNHQLAGFKFRRQHPIGSFIVDFYCPAKHLAIEIDGDSHEEQVAYDQKRTAILNKYGINVIRFTNQQVYEDIETVLGEIQAVLGESFT
jgi:very-short-patch-repair endonuclease